MKLNLIDEYQLCVHPVIAGSGLPLFKNINEKISLKLVKTKTFGFGAIILYHEPTKNDCLYNTLISTKSDFSAKILPVANTRPVIRN